MTDVETQVAELAKQVTLLTIQVTTLVGKIDTMTLVTDERLGRITDAISQGDAAVSQHVQTLWDAVKSNQTLLRSQGEELRSHERAITRIAGVVDDEDRGIGALNDTTRRHEDLVISAKAIWWLVGVLGAGNVAAVATVIYQLAS